VGNLTDEAQVLVKKEEGNTSIVATDYGEETEAGENLLDSGDAGTEIGGAIAAQVDVHVVDIDGLEPGW